MNRRNLLIGAASALFVPAIVRASSLMDLRGYPMTYGDRLYWIRAINEMGQLVTERLTSLEPSKSRIRRLIGCGDEYGEWKISHQRYPFVGEGRFREVLSAEPSLIRMHSKLGWRLVQASRSAFEEFDASRYYWDGNRKMII